MLQESEAISISV